LKTICIICARSGSKGLPNKNLKKIGDEFLLERPIKHALDSGVVDVVLVSTDSIEIAELAKAYGAIVPFLRPKEISGDLATTEDTLKHALLTYEEMIGEKFDLAVFLTATDIFRNPSWIRQCVQKLQDNPCLESVFVGYKTHKNFWEKQDDGTWKRLRDWMSVYSSRQIRRLVVREDTGLACASRASLWRMGRRIGDIVEIIEIDDDFTFIDIHTEEDLVLAELAMSVRKSGQ